MRTADALPFVRAPAGPNLDKLNPHCAELGMPPENARF
jgi:hypothetical protein